MRRAGGLLEWLAAQMEMEYLSDLRCLGRKGWDHLARLLKEISPEAASLEEWNDALWYLLRMPPAPSGAEAREQLLLGICRQRDGLS